MEYKAVSGVLDFEQDWSTWLSSGDLIDTSTWVLETGIVSDGESNTSTAAQIIISGGAAGKVYKVQNEITTTNGLTSEQTWFLTVQTRII